MNLKVYPTEKLSGKITIPGSKSHTIRGVVMAALAEGVSRLENPLHSDDTKAAFQAVTALGAEISATDPKEWVIRGFGGKPRPPAGPLDMLNSGTSTNLVASVAALADFEVIIDGDASIRKRPVQPLLNALVQLGAQAESVHHNQCPPLRLRGPLQGGLAEVDCRSSQYVSSLLITCPLLPEDTEIQVRNLCEAPYIQMTLDWLTYLGIQYRQEEGYNRFFIPGRQGYASFSRSIPADWSSATFPLCAAAMLKGSDCLIQGLDLQDSQADREVLTYLARMGAKVDYTEPGLRVQGGLLEGKELDLNNTPDALPAMSVIGCLAKGVTKLTNVAHARIKETDRLRVMAEELGKMGAKIQETADGLIIEHSTLRGAKVHGHHDHRVVMALSLAGMAAEGITEIDTAEAVGVTFPNYFSLMQSLGCQMLPGNHSDPSCTQC